MRVAGLFLAAIAAALLWASDALACDEARHARPAHNGPGDTRPPLVIGDSTMWFSVPTLRSLGLESDAKVCRIFFTGVEILKARLQAGTLPKLSVLALGAN
jgi:hypothetical protein